jgi:hypothetical protein
MAISTSSGSHPDTNCLCLDGRALEVFVWASAYTLVDAAPAGPFRDVVYFAFVNYTTLGYGDIVPAARWRLIGPMTAMNGVLLFAWSTAVIFEILRKILERVDLSPRKR